MADNNNVNGNSSGSGSNKRIMRDFISTLPNELLCYIFGFLPFKEAGRASVLSTRFQEVWLDMMKIDFQEGFFVNDNETEENKRIQRRGFVEFASKWMENFNGSKIETFSLKFSRPGDFTEDMRDIIGFAVARGVKELNLDFHDPFWGDNGFENRRGVFGLPVQVYGHKDLESLKLSACNILVSEFRYFSALKELSVGWIQMGPNAVRNLLVNCPLLESFSMKKCWSVHGHLDIPNPSRRLKTLVLDKCNFTGGFLMIEAPNLTFFKYNGKADRFFFERQVRSLQEAQIDFGLEYEFSSLGANLYDLLDQLLSVRVLTVCSYLLQVIPTGDEPLGMRRSLNVRHLTLKACMHSFEFFGIRFMLKSCSRLEKLTIDITPSVIFPDYQPPFPLEQKNFWTKDLVVFRCMRISLKVIEVKGFRGTVNEFLVLQYLIYFGSVLEELNIYLADEIDGEGGNRQEYLGRGQWIANRIKRGSPNLRISFY